MAAWAASITAAVVRRDSRRARAAIASTRAKIKTTISTERAAALVAALALAGCSRKNEAAPAGDAASSAAPVASWSGPPYVANESDAGAASAIAAHFAGVPARDLETVSVDLSTPGRRATLVKIAGKPTSDAKPFVVVADEDGKHVLWSRARPVAGIMAPVGPIALAAGPKDRVALAACDPPTSVIALRLWDHDGAPFADFQALSNETCDAIALAYGPRRGWLIAIARTGETRVQLVKENGSMTWPTGLDVGVRSRANALAPPAVAFDTDDTFLVAQIAQPSGEPGSPYHALVFRYDVEGTAIWAQAVDIAFKGGGPGQIAKLQKRHDGVAITLPDRAVVIKPSGAFEPLR